MKHKTVLSRVFRKRPEEDGNAALEFALVLPFLLAILMGMVEFGRVLFNQQVITNAARDASRASATDFEPYIDAANRVLGPAHIPSPALSCTTSPSAGETSICQTTVTIPVGAATTDAHQVAIAYNIQYITPLGSLLELIAGNSGWGDGVMITSTAVMRE